MSENVAVGDTVQILLSWDLPSVQIGATTYVVSASCSGQVSGQVPSGSAPRPALPVGEFFDEAGQGFLVAGSQAFADNSFTVLEPTPPPTPRPTPKPTPRPTPTATPKPPPKPLPTPTPFFIGGGGGGSGGGSAEGGAACSGGIGRDPTGNELSAAIARLASGADTTSIQIDLLSSNEYYSDVGAVPINFVMRLYDDVLRHDPTPVELDAGLAVVTGAGATGRRTLARRVALSPEARAIGVDSVFHALLTTYPNDADLALWINRLPGSVDIGTSGTLMLEEIAGSAAYYVKVGGNGSTFVSKLYEDLLNRQPTASELTEDAALIAQINAGSAAARLEVAVSVATSTEFRTDEITSFYNNYLHQTCGLVKAEECVVAPQAPTANQLGAALTSMAGGSTEESIIAGVLGSDQYFENHGGTQTGFIEGVYEDLIGRPATDAEIQSALTTYPNDGPGHVAFASAMAKSLAYHALLIALDYQQLLLSAPTEQQTQAAEAILTGSVTSPPMPDERLIETIVGTPAYYADAGGTDSRFVAFTISSLLVRNGGPSEEGVYLAKPAPHDATWQAAVAEDILLTREYRTDFIRGVYARFLSYNRCAEVSGNAGVGTGFFDKVPGGWFGLGVLVGVGLMGACIATFFTLERRRFSRIYPNEARRHHE